MSTATATATGHEADDVTISELVAFDLYRDIHKAIRNELFAVTTEAGSLDPADHTSRRRHARRVHALADLLTSHALHEDANLGPEVARLDPTAQLDTEVEHANLEARMHRIAELADLALGSDADRAASHALYLELAAFTGAYLQHQDHEERVLMRLLADHLDMDALLALHQQILASVAPDVMRRCLELMLPAINIVDRTEMLAGMRATAPAEVFAGTWALAGEVLPTSEYLATAARLHLVVDATKLV
jgi:hypothetical protein